ncbi:MAG: glycosyltransferase, partial [Rhodospirillaceae bacterium]|nr:glycosyltransferase [Rhodospirillaceae bacterium]
TELRTLGRNDIGFVVAGNMNLSRSLPGDLGTLGRAGLGLADYAEKHHVADLITFLGHIDEPERLIAGVDALIKPTRENNPWGRDILEALAAGKPVFSVGQYDRFVTTGKTGILQPQWDAAALARGLSHLADNDDLLAEMGRAAAERTARLCDGPTQANSLVKIWQRIGT